MTKSFISYSILFLASFFSLLLFCSMLWITDRFGDTTLESIIFHYSNELIGLPSKYYYSYAKRVIFSIVAACVLVAVARALVNYFQQYFLRRIAVLFSLCLLFVAVLTTVIRFEVLPYLLGTVKGNSFIAENYLSVENLVVFPKNKRNVVVLVAESMEKTFFESFSPPLIPFLQNLAEENLSCTLFQGKNLSWTTAGLTGLLLGVPFYAPAKNLYQPADKLFLPGAESILTIFENNGYTVNYLTGSNAEFGGKKNIFTTHTSTPGIYDLTFFTNMGWPVSGKWGLKDKHFYQAAKNLIVDMAAAKKPFFAIMQTVDTHSKAVSFGDYPEPYGDDRDAFIAADYMIAEFISWLKSQDFYGNTTILIVGDHLYMNNFLGEQRLSQPRTIYNVFINTVLDGKISVSQRKATMMDMGPSLLEAVGVQLPQGRMGLGHSIFDMSAQTLIEQYEPSVLTDKLSGYSEFYNNFFLSAKNVATSLAKRSGTVTASPH